MWFVVVVVVVVVFLLGSGDSRYVTENSYGLSFLGQVHKDTDYLKLPLNIVGIVLVYIRIKP